MVSHMAPEDSDNYGNYTEKSISVLRQGHRDTFCLFVFLFQQETREPDVGLNTFHFASQVGFPRHFGTAWQLLWLKKINKQEII